MENLILSVLNSVIKTFIRFIIETQVFVSVCSASLVFQTCIRTDVENFWVPVACVFFLTLIAYNVLRIIKNKTFVEKRTRDAQKIIVIISMLFMLELMPKLETQAIWLILFCLGPTSLYSLQWIPILKLNSGLRNIPLLKSFLIAIIWSGLTVFLPILQNNVELQSVYGLFIERFLFIAAITIPFDIKDMAIDKATGVDTFPLIFGLKVTKTISLSILILYMVFSLLVILQWHHVSVLLIPPVLSTLISGVLILQTKKESKLYHYAIKLESTSLIQSLLFGLVIFVF